MFEICCAAISLLPTRKSINPKDTSSEGWAERIAHAVAMAVFPGAFIAAAYACGLRVKRIGETEAAKFNISARAARLFPVPKRGASAAPLYTVRDGPGGVELIRGQAPRPRARRRA